VRRNAALWIDRLGRSASQSSFTHPDRVTPSSKAVLRPALQGTSAPRLAPSLLPGRRLASNYSQKPRKVRRQMGKKRGEDRKRLSSAFVLEDADEQAAWPQTKPRSNKNDQ